MGKQSGRGEEPTAANKELDYESDSFRERYLNARAACLKSWTDWRVEEGVVDYWRRTIGLCMLIGAEHFKHLSMGK
jgi:hypothetical protein